MTQHLVILGCGIVGACIAYELSFLEQFQITVLDPRSFPGQGSTGAALGICMGVISHKTKGRSWQLRAQSLARYETLIPELNAALQIGLQAESKENHSSIPYNDRGVIQLYKTETDLTRWTRLIATRREQGYALEQWSKTQVREVLPDLGLTDIQGAIYSPQDRQVDPLLLLQSLVRVSQNRGVTFRFNTPVQSLDRLAAITGAADWVVVAAGLGLNDLYGANPDQNLGDAQPMIQPVLGQAWQVALPQSLWAGDVSDVRDNMHPVITVDDLHFVPLLPASDRSYTTEPVEQSYAYWLGATVEFPTDLTRTDALEASETIAAELWEKALQIYPHLGEGTLQAHWSGLRPRPINQPAPLLQWSTIAPHILLATGHYRNGVFLAPGTALWVKAEIEAKLAKL